MASDLLKTIDFGDGVKRAVAPEWNNVQNKPFELLYGETDTYIVGISENVISAEPSVQFEHVAGVTFELLTGGINITATVQGETQTMEGGEPVIESLGDAGNIVAINDMFVFYVISADNTDLDGLIFPKAGVWFLDLLSAYGYGTTRSIQFNSGTFQGVVEVKTLNKAFIPELGYATLANLYAVLGDYCTNENAMFKTNPSGTGSFSMNRKANTTVGDYSHAEGYNNEASGAYAHAEGNDTVASANFSHAEGGGSVASNTYAHAEGGGTEASGSWSHSEGLRSKAQGSSSHAEGTDTVASGTNSHAEGLNTIAKGYNQHVQGRNNVEDTGSVYAHIVGNGTSANSRHNAHTLDWDGNAWFAGTIEGTALILLSTTTTADGTKKFKITVDDTGTLTATEV